MTVIRTEHYKSEARKAVKNRVLLDALADVQDRLGRGTAQAYHQLPEGPELRLKAHDMRMHAVENLDVLLETLAENVQKNGGKVYFAEDAQAAIDYCLKLAQKHNVKPVVVDFIGKRWLCPQKIGDLTSSEFNEYCASQKRDEICTYHNNVRKQEVTAAGKKAAKHVSENHMHAEEVKEYCTT